MDYYRQILTRKEFSPLLTCKIVLLCKCKYPVACDTSIEKNKDSRDAVGINLYTNISVPFGFLLQGKAQKI